MFIEIKKIFIPFCMIIFQLHFVSGTNFVIFIADDLGYGDVGFLGNTTINTPHIDSIATEGAILDHHLAPASVCTPSRAAFLTGRHPIRMGMLTHTILRVNIFLSSISGLPQNETTIAKILQNNDYRTALIGKWHLGLNCQHRNDFCHHPLNHGFNHFYGIPLTNLQDFGDEGLTVFESRFPFIDKIFITIILITILTGYLFKKYKLLSPLKIICFQLVIVLLVIIISNFYTNLKRFNSVLMRNFDVVEQPIHLDSLTPRLVYEGREFLENCKKDDKNFFLVMAWSQVHTALHNTKSFINISKHGKYGDNIEEMDWSTGEILKTLEKLNLKNDTFVYFTSDNGGHLEEHGINGQVEGGWNGIYKGSKTQGAAEGGIRVPTAIRWPKYIKPGLRIKQPTGLIDIAPTVAEIAGVKMPKDRIIDGKSLLPLFSETASTVNDEALHEVLAHYCGTQLHAARYTPKGMKNVYKLYYYKTIWKNNTYQCRNFVCDCFSKKDMQKLDIPILYDIQNDPKEDYPLNVNNSKYNSIIDHINKAVKKHLLSVKPSPSQFDWLTVLPRPWLQPCCNFPFCKCVDEKYASLNLHDL